MKKALILATAAVCGTLTLAGPAQAERDGPRKGKMRAIPMEELDANGDGEVTYDEFADAHMRRLEQRFEMMDANGDGVLTEDELKDARSRMRGQKRDRIRQGGGGPPDTPGE